MTIKEIRESLGITQIHVVKTMRNKGFTIQRTTYSEKERGIRHFSAKEIQYLCILFDVDIKDITLV